MQAGLILCEYSICIGKSLFVFGLKNLSARTDFKRMSAFHAQMYFSYEYLLTFLKDLCRIGEIFRNAADAGSGWMWNNA